MAGQTFVTATVWGQGRAAACLTSQAGRLGAGDEECMICRDEVAASVAFQPCGHAVCFGCVESMRAKNIFKVGRRGGPGGGAGGRGRAGQGGARGARRAAAGARRPVRACPQLPPRPCRRARASSGGLPASSRRRARCPAAMRAPSARAPRHAVPSLAMQADKGVKCPFCRCYIDGYRSLKR
jgi:hypothetical protein